MGGGKHNKGCCDTSCTMATDSFNRTASDLGSNWTHASGQWKTVATGDYAEGYAEALVDSATALNKKKHVTPDESMYVAITIWDEITDSSNVYRIILNAVDLDNYHFAEYVSNGASDSILRLGRRTGGSETILVSKTITGGGRTPPDGQRYCYAMVADNEFCAGLDLASTKVYYTEPFTPIASGYYAGMGADETAKIAQWDFLHHAQTKKNCPYCVCRCENRYMPLVLYAHIYGEGRMVSLDCDITLKYDEDLDLWIGTNPSCCGEEWELHVSCHTPPTQGNAKIVKGCKGTALGHDGSDPDYIDVGWRRVDMSLSTCSPINLVYGPFDVFAIIPSTEDECYCGNYEQTGKMWIVVTE